MGPIRYYIINTTTDIMHIDGLCRHTQPRSYPVRLFDSPEELVEYAGRPLRLCARCNKALTKINKG